MYKGVACGSKDMNDILAGISKERGVIISTAAGNGYLYITYEVSDSGGKNV